MVVTDLDSTIGFYRDTLGFDVDTGKMTPGESGWAILRRGDVVLLFHASTGWAVDLLPDGKAEICGLITYRMYVDDVALLYEYIRGRVTIVRKLETEPGGTPEFSIRDCNGFILTFIQAEYD